MVVSQYFVCAHRLKRQKEKPDVWLKNQEPTGTRAVRKINELAAIYAMHKTEAKGET
jgi:hypothetical protein